MRGSPSVAGKGGDEFFDEGVRADFNEFIDTPDDENETIFKFRVIDNGYDFIKKPAKKVIGEVQWDGNQYPKFIRNGVDISNGRGRYDDMDISKLSHDMSLYYWCNKNQPDLVPIIIRELCEVCSWEDKTQYTTKMTYGKTTYENLPDYPGPLREYPYPKGELSKKKR